MKAYKEMMMTKAILTAAFLGVSAFALTPIGAQAGHVEIGLSGVGLPGGYHDGDTSPAAGGRHLVAEEHHGSGDHGGGHSDTSSETTTTTTREGGHGGERH